jgi:hypothetical protein
MSHSVAITDPASDHIKRHSKDSRKHVYTLLLVPRVSTLVSRILEEEGVLGDVTISAYQLQFIPVAEDVISLEHDNTLRELLAVRKRFISRLVIKHDSIGWRRNHHL